MSTRVVVDPVTRIEGHLRVEAMLNDKNVIEDAISSGTMWRGLEVILKGRDPRDAWAFCERICGVCTTVHALASVRSVESALDITIPKNAEIIRNIMELTQYVQDHVIHFYHLHALDWVDVVSALKADPAATAALAQKVSPNWPTSTPGYFSDVAGTLKKFVESGQLGIFQNAYWGHPAYKLPPEANLMAVAHYLEALKWQKEIVKIHTVFGGKNPHPHYLVGGTGAAINLQRRQRHQHGTAEFGAWPDQGRAGDRGRVVHSRSAGDGFVLSGMDHLWRRAGELHGVRRHSAEWRQGSIQVPVSRAASSSTRT